MAEFKFSCPHCSQHIQCDTGYAGMQINCPACQKAIVIPQAPRSAAAPPAASAPPPPPPPSSLVPPPPPPGAAPALATRQSTAAPSTGKRFTGAPSLTGAPPPPKKKSGALKMVLSVTAALVGAAIGFFGVQFALHHFGAGKSKGNPAAQVATPTANEAMQALGILSKVHSAYTNMTGATVEGTFSMFLDISNITAGDLDPDRAGTMKNADRHPQGMPRVITNLTEVTFKGARALSNWYYFSGEAVSKVDRLTVSNTIASWSSDKGKFMFMDQHMKGMSPTYQQLPDAAPGNDPAEQFRNIQQLFEDPANLAKVIKDLGQTADESVNGQDCYTLTARVLGQKVKIWVDKTSYLIWQWQITLGGKISDADVDDAVSLFATAVPSVPPAQLEMAKTEIKKRTPVMTKVRGTLTFTSNSIRQNPNLTADDFNYAVPPGIRLVNLNARQTPNTATAAANRQRNTCINNLRQIDGAKNQWALEKGKKAGDTPTEADIAPYVRGGVLPQCPAGGSYIIGKIGEKPTCSIAGHALP